MCTIEKMKRLLALLLLSAIGSFPFGSAFAEMRSAANLPACCKVSGKHHCAMQPSGSKPGVRSIAEKCPYAPAITPGSVSVPVFPSPVREFLCQGASHSLVAQEQASGLFRIGFDRNRQKRGPPVFFL
jgi:hypothetical protein